jgi:hypothetical protein
VAGVHSVLSGQSLEESEEIDNSLFVDGQDVVSLFIDASVDEDSLDDVSSSPLDSTVMTIDMSVSVNVSDSCDDSVLSEVEPVDSAVGSSKESSELSNSLSIGFTILGRNSNSVDLGVGVADLGVGIVDLGVDIVDLSVGIVDLGVNVSDCVDISCDGACGGGNQGDNSVDLTNNIVGVDGELGNSGLGAFANSAVEMVVTGSLARVDLLFDVFSLDDKSNNLSSQVVLSLSDFISDNVNSSNVSSSDPDASSS